MMNILTFDIEEWFHILDNASTQGKAQWESFEYRLEANIERILTLLEEENQCATFFVLGWVAREFPQVLRKIHQSGYEIATHSDMHQLAYTQSRAEFAEDLRQSIQSISEITGQPVTSYRAPGFSLKKENVWVFDVLAENGIEIDCSVFPARRAHGGFEEFGQSKPTMVRRNGYEIKEFPINVFTMFGRNVIFSGGGYFRLLPYPLIRQLFRRADYVMTYFHPRDFDADQPVLRDLSPARKFKSYYGIRDSFVKLKRLINEFSFVDLRQADRLVNWEAAHRFNI